MAWYKWVLFSIQILITVGPKLMDLVKTILEALDAKRQPLSGAPLSGQDKRELANPVIKRAVAKATGNSPDPHRVDVLREWTLQRVRGRQWQAPVEIAQDVGLSKFYG